MSHFIYDNTSLMGAKADSGPLTGPSNQSLGASEVNALVQATYDLRSFAKENVFNVKFYGAKGDGTTNDQPAIQAAINAAQAAGGGIVFFPAGTYGVCCPAGPVDGTNACIRISESNITLQGVRGASVIKQFARGMANPATSWEIVQYAGLPAWLPSHAYSLGASVIANGHEWSCATAGTSASSGGPVLSGTPTVVSGQVLVTDGTAIWRYTDHMFVGHLVYMKKGTNLNVDRLSNTSFRDLEFDGNAGGWPDAEYPLSAGALQPWTAGGYVEVTTGKVFDMLNKLFFIDGGLVYGVHFDHVKFHGNRAEGIYCGTNDCWDLNIDHCEGYNCGGSIVSCTAEMKVTNSKFYHSGTLAENLHIIGDIIYDNCTFADGINGYVDGVNYNFDAGIWAWARVTNCTFRNISIRGWTNAGYGANYEISNNLFIDCGYASADCEAIRINSFFGGAPYHTYVHHNTILCADQECLSGITITGDQHDVYIADNFVGRSTKAIGNGHYIRHPYSSAITPASTNVVYRNNRCDPWFENGFHVSTANTEQYVGDIDATNINSDGSPWFTFMNADGVNKANPLTTFFGIGGNFDHQYTAVPGIKNWAYTTVDNKLCTLVSSGSFNNENWAVIQSDAHTVLRGDRYINGNIKLIVKYNIFDQKWYEVGYQLRGNSLPPTANDLDLISPNTINQQAPVIQAYNCTSVSLTPGSATTFNNWVNFIPGERVRVICNANTTIAHNAGSTKKLMLTGAANFSPGGTGGEITLIVPNSGSNLAYEINRIVY